MKNMILQLKLKEPIKRDPEFKILGHNNVQIRLMKIGFKKLVINDNILHWVSKN